MIKLRLPTVDLTLFNKKNVNDSRHLVHNSCLSHHTTPVVVDVDVVVVVVVVVGKDYPFHVCIAVGTPYLLPCHNKNRGTGSRTHESTPHWGPAHIVHSRIGCHDHTAVGTPGDKAPMCSLAGARTFPTHIVALAGNAPPGHSTVADVDVVDVDDVDHDAVPVRNSNDTLARWFYATANSGKLRGVSYQNPVHCHSPPFSFGLFESHLCLVSLSVHLVVVHLSMENLVFPQQHPAGFWLNSVHPETFIVS